eukprot:TRINITY_DN2408_c0_g1_i3.p1 TRINITY_DN2408_c0_g1~~TRINITY_DN2408_c0_g1_i3.p1  ORF type:complete len:241 (+),score=68.60 TRINITY_DN2408_c0_g1_i3:60-782(+)
MSAEDPFYKVYNDVSRDLQENKRHIEVWRRLMTEGKRDEADQKLGEIRQINEDVRMDIEDLRRVIQGLLDNPKKYKIPPTEIEQRKKLVDQASFDLSEMEKAVRPPPIGGVTKAKENLFGPAPTGKYAKLQEAIDDDHDRFIDSNMQVQKDMMEEQDVQLDELGRAVGRLGDMSITINKELTEQEQIIQELDHEVDRTQGMLSQGIQKVNKLLKDSDSSHLCIIAVLFVILVVLVVLIFI